MSCEGVGGVGRPRRWERGVQLVLEGMGGSGLGGTGGGGGLEVIAGWLCLWRSVCDGNCDCDLNCDCDCDCDMLVGVSCVAGGCG